MHFFKFMLHVKGFCKGHNKIHCKEGGILGKKNVKKMCLWKTHAMGTNKVQNGYFLESKDRTESNTSTSYLYLLLSIRKNCQLHYSLYGKRINFNFHISNFLFLRSNTLSSPVYGADISQLIWYHKACSSYKCLILRVMRLSNKLLGQGYIVPDMSGKVWNCL